MDALSCLAQPPAAFHATSFADAAIARALHFSMSAAASSSSCSSAGTLLADLAYAPAPPVTSCDSVLVADSPRRRSPAGARRQQQQRAPAGGRAGKRRSRASKRAPTTYISTDPANFRLMVQQITGVQADVVDDASGVMLPAAAFDASSVMMLLGADGAHGAGAYGNIDNPLLMADEASLHHHHHHQQQQEPPCFPTLDSWNVMYERNNQLL